MVSALMTKGHTVFVVKDKRKKTDRTRVTRLLNAYRVAKDAEKRAREAAEEARTQLIALAGDAEVLVDKNGVQLVKLPERSRRTLPVVDALELHPDLDALINTSYYRVVSR
jgi:hypothetical protein